MSFPSRPLASVWALSISISLAAAAYAVPAVPYTEDFDTTANWSTSTASLVAPTLVGSGGPDGSSYVSRSASASGFPDETPFVQFRAHDEFNPSNHAFEGDWIGGGLNQFSVYVRHNAPVALPFFARFTGPTGGTGVVFETASPTPGSADWTKLIFDIDPSSPYFTPEGPPTKFFTTMADVGHIQIGYTVPSGFGSDPNTYTFDMDLVSSARIPEPSACLLALGAAACGIAARRRRR